MYAGRNKAGVMAGGEGPVRPSRPASDSSEQHATYHHAAEEGSLGMRD